MSFSSVWIIRFDGRIGGRVLVLVKDLKFFLEVVIWISLTLLIVLFSKYFYDYFSKYFSSTNDWLLLDDEKENSKKIMYVIDAYRNNDFVTEVSINKHLIHNCYLLLTRLSLTGDLYQSQARLNKLVIYKILRLIK